MITEPISYSDESMEVGCENSDRIIIKWPIANKWPKNCNLSWRMQSQRKHCVAQIMIRQLVIDSATG